MIKLLNITPLLLILAGSMTAIASEKLEMIGCVNSLGSSISNHWKTDDSTLYCDSVAKRCFIIGDKADFSFTVPAEPSLVEEAVDIDVASRKMKISHYYVQFEKNGASDVHYLDLSNTPQGMYGRTLAPEKKDKATKVTLSPITGKIFEPTLLAQIKGNMKLIGSNLAENSFPPGWDKAKYVEECKHRLSGCQGLTKLPQLQELFIKVEACKP